MRKPINADKNKQGVFGWTAIRSALAERSGHGAFVVSFPLASSKWRPRKLSELPPPSIYFAMDAFAGTAEFIQSVFSH
jgi:hypothetical protein